MLCAAGEDVAVPEEEAPPPLPLELRLGEVCAVSGEFVFEAVLGSPKELGDAGVVVG